MFKLVTYYFNLIFVCFITISSANATINVVIKTPECVVFSSDSRSTGVSTEISTDTYEKIAQVSRFVMFQTRGSSLPGLKNLRTTVEDFRWKFKFFDSSSFCFDTVVFMFRQYIDGQKALGVDYRGFYLDIAGADSQGTIRYATYEPEQDKYDEKKTYSVYWGGSGKYVCERIFHGIDGELSKDLETILRRVSSDSSVSESLAQLVKLTISQFTMTEYVGEWTLWDAINYAEMLTRTTVLVDRMTGGHNKIDKRNVNPTTGGQILTCAATRQGLMWISSPDYSSANR